MSSYIKSIVKGGSFKKFNKRQDTLLLGYNYPGVEDFMWCD